MQEFKKLTVIFGIGLAGVVIALIGTFVTHQQQKQSAQEEAQQVHALPADSQAPVAAPSGVPAQ